MEYKQFKDSVLNHLSNYRKKLSNKCGVWNYKGLNVPKEHILPEENKWKNFMFDNETVVKKDINSMNIKLHNAWGNLNSSQVMCINFFYPLIKTEKGKEILLRVIDNALPELKIENNMKIVEAEFEKDEELDNTNFDFYVKISNEERKINITWEIKYTEEGFGKTKPNDKTGDRKYTHKEKFEKIYEPELNKTLNFKNSNISMEEFLCNYQINRNVFYIRNNDDVAVFLTTKENEKTKIELEIINNYKNAYSVYWEDIVKLVQNEVDGELKSYYNEFQNKYLFWMNDEGKEQI